MKLPQFSLSVLLFAVFGVALAVGIWRRLNPPEPYPLKTFGSSIGTSSYCGEDEEHEFTVWLTPEILKLAPTWQRTSPNPPLSANEALVAADRFRQGLVKNRKLSDDHWCIVGAELTPYNAEQGLWYWLVTFQVRRTGRIPQLRLAVLMNGTVVEPTLVKKGPEKGSGVFDAGKALSWGNLRNEMSAYIQHNYMRVVFLELVVRRLDGCRARLGELEVVRSRHPGRNPKLEGSTLSYPAFEPLTDPVGNATTWVRDNLNRVTQETNQLGASRLFAYDAASNVVQETDRNGRVSQFSYDNLYRPTQERWLATGGAVIYTANLGYNAASELVSASDNVSTYALNYDNLGRRTRVDNAGTPNMPTVVLDSTYNALGNRASLGAVQPNAHTGQRTWR